ncbi:MAG: hypothetical protein ACHQ0J_13530 [Candidatus Dormibacterales bacterium]
MQKLRFIVPFLGLVVAAFAVASISASASSTSSSTNLNVSVPSTITMTGIAASYTASIPAGTTFDEMVGPAVITTNNATGYSLTVASNGDFVAGSHSFPAANDQVSAGGGTPGSLSTTPFLIAQSGAAGTDTLPLHNSITVPPTQPGATYTLVETYVASTN